jgi:adenylate cyclase
MSEPSDVPRLEDPGVLSGYQGWSEEVYRDLLDVDRGALTRADFDARYLARRAILVLDVTGFTLTTIHGGAIGSFLRILDVHRVGFPVLQEFGATFIRAFADDVTALFDAPGPAVDAALELHRRIAAHNQTATHETPPECCIGIGFGDVYEIGPNHAMGDEMNRASVLGEDVARGGETLLTEGAQQALAGRRDLTFERQAGDDLVFPYFKASAAG